MAYGRGPQSPEKYAPYQTGSNYARWGEQPGLIYIPWQDAYMVDPEASKNYLEGQGIEGPEEPPGMWETAAAAALPVGAGALVTEGMKNIPSWKEIGGLLGIGKDAANTVTTAARAVPSISSPIVASVSPSIPAIPGAAAAGGAYPVGTAIGGGTLMSDGTVLAMSSQPGLLGAGGAAQGGLAAPKLISATKLPSGGYGSAGSALNYLGPVGVAAGGYGLHQAIKNRDPVGGALSGAGLGAGAYGTAALLGFNPATWGTLAGLGPLGWLAGGGLLLGSVLPSIFGHKGTKEYQKEWASDLRKQGVTGFDNFKKVSAENAGKIQRDPNAATWNWNDPESRKNFNAYDIISSIGPYQAFGNDWDKYDTDTKAKITQAIWDKNLWDPEKGEWLITDAEAAKKLRDQVLSGELSPTVAANPYKAV